MYIYTCIYIFYRTNKRQEDRAELINLINIVKGGWGRFNRLFAGIYAVVSDSNWAEWPTGYGRPLINPR